MPANPIIFDLHRLQRLRRQFQRKFDLPVDVVGLDGGSIDNVSECPSRQPLCALLCKNPATRACCNAEHRRAIEWAFEGGESYSFICHAGLLVTCTPLANGSNKQGALLSGKTLPEAVGDEMVTEVLQRLSIFGLAANDVRAAVNGHACVSGVTLQQAADTLLDLALEILGLDLLPLNEHRDQARQQAQIAERIHAIKRDNSRGASKYPYEHEKELIEKVKLGDRRGATGVLNKILGAVLFHDPMGSAVLKTRLVELLAVLSRATAEAGVNVEKILQRNLVYFREILAADTDVGLCMIISRALNEFLDIVCVSRDAHAETPVTAVINYIKDNYNRELTVRELSRQAHLSPSRISHLFQQKLGISMTEVVTNVRLDQAKKLLLETNLNCTEIAFQVGYNDQSYFTRIFHRCEKVTPKQFRKLNCSGSTSPHLKPGTLLMDLPS